MELWCVIVVTLFSSVAVSAYPNGYGVKGGALAKADASAVAGAFGGYGAAPSTSAGAEPSEASYLGSFSKSASSSFASSSASASSSSFSYSGSRILPKHPSANGLSSGNSAAVSGYECSSGSCDTGASLPDTHGTGNTASGQTYIGAKAAAAAGSVTYAATPGSHSNCNGGECFNLTPSNCKGSTCDHNPSAYESNDIAVNIHEDSGEAKKHKTDIITIADNKTPGPTVSGHECLNGNCGLTAPKPQLHGLSDAYPSASAAAPSKPDIYFTAPKHEPPCTTANCGSVTGTYDMNLPSSYNVPIHGPDVNSSSDVKSPCASGTNCGNHQPNPQRPSESGDCASSSENCANKKTQHSSQKNISVFVPLAPPGPGNCATPNCGLSPPLEISAFPSKQPSYSSQSSNNLPFTGVKSHHKLPIYTGGFGGPAGVLRPNDYSVPSNVPIGNYKPATPTDSYNPTSGSQSLSQDISKTPSESSSSINPSCPSGNCGIVPVYQSPNSGQSDFLGPAVCTSTNCGTQSSQNQPSVSSGAYNPSHYVPDNKISSGPQNKPTCTSGNCGTHPALVTPQYDLNGFPSNLNPSATAGSYKPSTCISGYCGPQPVNTYPQYPQSNNRPTGGFRGPAGILQPNDFHVPTNQPASSHKPVCTSGTCVSQSGPSPQFDSTYQNNHKPSLPTVASNLSCVSGNCGSQPVNTSHYSQSNAGLTSGVHYKPAGASSGFGGPPGFLKPNDFNVPANQPTSNVQPSCSDGICPHIPQFGVIPQRDSSSPTNYKPSGTVGVYNPPCPSRNCGSQPGNNLSRYPQVSAGATSESQYKATGPANGFGGPAGFIKPSNFIPPSNNHASSYQPLCTGGICGPRSGPLPWAEHDSTIPSNNKPTASAGAYNLLCSSGNCGQQSSSQYIQNGAGAASGAHYKPGPSSEFGGPAGFLKPNDFSAPSTTGSCTSGICGPGSGQLPQPPVAQGSNNLCTSGTCGNKQIRPSTTSQYPGSSDYDQSGLSGSQTVAGAAASANARVYTGGFGGPPGFLKPYDEGKFISSISSSGTKYPATTHSTPGDGSSPYVKSLNDAGFGTQINAGTISTAGATAGSFGGLRNFAGGCKNGCGSNDQTSFGGLSLAGASAKSLASSGSSAGTGSYGGSFAGSSASAHASAGAVAKGGYGKR